MDHLMDLVPVLTLAVVILFVCLVTALALKKLDNMVNWSRVMQNEGAFEEMEEAWAQNYERRRKGLSELEIA